MARFDSSHLRLNEIQTIGTHNSYHLEPDATLKAKFIANYPLSRHYIKTIEYNRLPLNEQFDLGIRQIELDVFADPIGGRYAQPQGATIDTELPDEMKKPGLKVLHIQDVDFRSTCATFDRCLQTVKTWSDSHPNHLPILILVEAKDSLIPRWVEKGLSIEFTKPIPFDEAQLDSIDREIRSVFPQEQLITPDTVRGDCVTLNQAIQMRGWPLLSASRGKIMFALDNEGKIRDRYTRGHPSLTGRVMFVSARPGSDEAAFFKRNNPFDRSISRLVRQGYLVRTRADARTREARSNDTKRRDAAFASGAQFVSTDYPFPNQVLSNYSVTFPGNATMRCNPMNTSRGCQVRSHWVATASSRLP
ncbi:phosphatidylinositol-specific phospholipase C1-like protein [Oscillatoriales cyanobacterium LEGE 11467]|uniref:Phosphatidylinositol-specific phospholipase C1-like protein n=1 Tax=Zarconia navalis LEGE 11467 TaxID=1828826 RepID=A0A928W2X6_9CYAN|nr:phosphatidylinositol-specific phospholipase C1-like protein [Zarconia navalis LEGE 11467]